MKGYLTAFTGSEHHYAHDTFAIDTLLVFFYLDVR
jgi:hypothetical protein